VITGDFEVGTTATFADVRDSLDLMFVANFGWMTIANSGVVVFA
jgi:hypothetical protein